MSIEHERDPDGIRQVGCVAAQALAAHHEHTIIVWRGGPEIVAGGVV